MRRWYFFIGILLGALLVACKNDIKDVHDLFDQPDTDYDLIINPIIEYSDSAKLKVKISAPQMKRENKKGASNKDIFDKGVQADIYNDAGKPQSYLIADYGENQRSKDRLYVRGNVIFYNIEQDTLKAEELYWNQKTDKIHTDKFVNIKLTKQQKIIQGFGFESNSDFTELEVKNMKGITYLSNEGQ